MLHTIEKRLRKILKEELDDSIDIENIDINDELIDYGLNSSGMLGLIIGIEKEFCFELKDEDFEISNFKTLHSLINYIEKKYK